MRLIVKELLHKNIWIARKFHTLKMLQLRWGAWAKGEPKRPLRYENKAGYTANP